MPSAYASFLRSFFTAFYTPIYFSYLNGHFKSSFKNKAVSRNGDALPWYTYPIIDFLRTRTFSDKIILEFGGGQSTLWWAQRSKKIITFEDNKEWYTTLKKIIPSNTDLFLVSNESPEKCVSGVENILKTLDVPRFDIIIIDGLYRREMVDIACQVVSRNGAIICDNSSVENDTNGYGFHESFKNRMFMRADFFGHAPGVILPHCTSIFFTENCFLFDSNNEIPHRI
ncbi:MAG: hypothetical protein HYW78_00760 [Parcubacteria group bacterium]|nr:hypothetical protein [Parcubacteria group bacterium]